MSESPIDAHESGCCPPEDPFLSVLVPAYEYPEGIQRILQALLPTEGVPLEILIHDDSASDRVQTVVLPWQEAYPRTVRYRRNAKPSGAVNNWNGLLTSARGQYLLLLHHDELPLTEGFSHAIQNEVQAMGTPRVLVLDLLLASRGNVRLRRHVPLWSKRLLLRSCPTYLYARNLIGAPSSWVVRREGCPAFDPQLQWLVDVDWYARILGGPGSVRISPNVQVASVQGEHRSITATLGSGITGLRKQEAEYLLQSGRQNIALRILRHRTFGDRVIRIVEVLAWATFRSLTTPFLRFMQVTGAQRMLESRMRLQPPPPREQTTR